MSLAALAAVVFVAFGGFYMATHTDFGWLFGASLFGRVGDDHRTGVCRHQAVAHRAAQGMDDPLVIQGRKILAVRPV